MLKNENKRKEKKSNVAGLQVESRIWFISPAPQGSLSQSVTKRKECASNFCPKVLHLV
jgi:hypothetical protein